MAATKKIACGEKWKMFRAQNRVSRCVRDRSSNFDEKRKQHPTQADEAIVGEAAPSTVGRVQQGEARRATPHRTVGLIST